MLTSFGVAPAGYGWMTAKKMTNHILTNQWTTWEGAPHTVRLNGDDVSAVAYIIYTINLVILVFFFFC
jgi:hypothetical protein